MGAGVDGANGVLEVLSAALALAKADARADARILRGPQETDTSVSPLAKGVEEPTDPRNKSYIYISIYIYAPLSCRLGPVADNHGTEQAQFPAAEPSLIGIQIKTRCVP